MSKVIRFPIAPDSERFVDIVRVAWDTRYTTESSISLALSIVALVEKKDMDIDEVCEFFGVLLEQRVFKNQIRSILRMASFHIPDPSRIWK